MESTYCIIKHFAYVGTSISNIKKNCVRKTLILIFFFKNSPRDCQSCSVEDWSEDQAILSREQQ